MDGNLKITSQPSFQAHSDSCGRGDVHEHHHDDDCDCGCGHNHEHEHHHLEHHHDDDCDCGRGHDHEHLHHEHHHDDDCDCGCGHDHHHTPGHPEDCQCELCHPHAEYCDVCGQSLANCTCNMPDDRLEKKVYILENPGCAHCASKMEAKIKELPGAYKTKTYILENLGCAHCASKMEEQIGRLDGVTNATITFATKQLRVTAKNPDRYLPDIKRICTSIESQVQVSEKDTSPKSQDTLPLETQRTSTKEPVSKEKKDLAVIITGAVLFIISEVLEHTGFGITVTLPINIIAYILLGGPVLLEAGRNILHGQIFDENFLMSIATLGAFAIREFPEAVGVMLFYRIGEFFEHKAVERSRGQIMDAVDMRPEVINLLVGDEIQVIPAEDTQIGDILLIRPGDRIPLDGVIVEGESRLDTSPITGEPVPVSVGLGDEITSGCVNTSGQLKMRVEKPLEESMVSRILDSVENAAANKPKIDRFITRFSKVYTPFVVLMAIGTAIIPSLFSGNWNYWVYTALTFLVMSCPCALVLSVPLAFFSGIGAGSKKGILFKGGVSIESLGHLGAVVMDKTGTITEGNFKLQKVVSAGDYSEQELLRICASCEQNSTHPIAVSIVTAAKQQNLSLDTPDTMKEIAGHGIAASLKEGNILCGNRKLMDRNHIPMENVSSESYGAEVYLAINGKLAGYLLISDTIKADAKSAISNLKALGLHTIMLTGDSEGSANAVAKETGIDDVYAKLLPQDKLNILTRVRNDHGAVMFVGDGINDAPVLAGADVGAAMGSGADAAIEAADAVFMNSSVESIPLAISIAKSTNRIAIQNVVFALIIKIAVMILGLMGFANMWMAVFADTGVAMLCVLNSIRILYKK